MIRRPPRSPLFPYPTLFRSQWSLAPCEAPTGLAIDRVHHRVFSGCRNKLMAISDATAGKVIATEPIGQGVDACRFDADRKSTRLNSSHGYISYAVFCLQKKH